MACRWRLKSARRREARIGATGFEPATSVSKNRRSTKPSYAPVEVASFTSFAGGSTETCSACVLRLRGGSIRSSTVAGEGNSRYRRTMVPGELSPSPARLARRRTSSRRRAPSWARARPTASTRCARRCARSTSSWSPARPWLKDGLERDFAKDESGYRKIGGGANTPAQAYFFRSSSNLDALPEARGLLRAARQPTRAVAGHGLLPRLGRSRPLQFHARSRRHRHRRQGRPRHAHGRRAPRDPSDSRRPRRRAPSTSRKGDANDRALIGYSDLP